MFKLNFNKKLKNQFEFGKLFENYSVNTQVTIIANTINSEIEIFKNLPSDQKAKAFETLIEKFHLFKAHVSHTLKTTTENIERPYDFDGTVFNTLITLLSAGASYLETKAVALTTLEELIAYLKQQAPNSDEIDEIVKPLESYVKNIPQRDEEVRKNILTKLKQIQNKEIDNPIDVITILNILNLCHGEGYKKEEIWHLKHELLRLLALFQASYFYRYIQIKKHEIESKLSDSFAQIASAIVAQDILQPSLKQPQEVVVTQTASLDIPAGWEELFEPPANDSTEKPAEEVAADSNNQTDLNIPKVSPPISIPTPPRNSSIIKGSPNFPAAWQQFLEEEPEKKDSLPTEMFEINSNNEVKLVSTSPNPPFSLNEQNDGMAKAIQNSNNDNNQNNSTGVVQPSPVPVPASQLITNNPASSNLLSPSISPSTESSAVDEQQIDTEIALDLPKPVYDYPQHKLLEDLLQFIIGHDWEDHFGRNSNGIYKIDAGKNLTVKRNDNIPDHAHEMLVKYKLIYADYINNPENRKDPNFKKNAEFRAIDAFNEVKAIAKRGAEKYKEREEKIKEKTKYGCFGTIYSWFRPIPRDSSIFYKVVAGDGFTENSDCEKEFKIVPGCEK